MMHGPTNLKKCCI